MLLLARYFRSLALTRKHPDALVTAKEYEVRSEFGRSDHETLGQLRKDFEALVQEKGTSRGSARRCTSS
jgi:hypothetical protein